MARKYAEARGHALHILTPEVTVTWANQKNAQKNISKIRQDSDSKQNVLGRVRQCFSEKPEKRDVPIRLTFLFSKYTHGIVPEHAKPPPIEKQASQASIKLKHKEIISNLLQAFDLLQFYACL